MEHSMEHSMDHSLERSMEQDLGHQGGCGRSIHAAGER